jgi:hypothetical protein
LYGLPKKCTAPAALGTSLDQRRFPGPVRADDGGQPAGGHLQVDIPEDRLVAVGDGQILHAHGRARFRLLGDVLHVR